MRLYFCRIIKVFVLLIMISVTVLVMQKYFFCHGYGNDTMIEQYYLEDENSIDVVLIGSSEIYAGFSSNLAYKDYKYTSFPFCVTSNPVTLMKYELKEVLKYQKPKLILIEVNGITYETDDKYEGEAETRRLTDGMKFSKNKIDAINAMNNSDYSLNYLMPFVKYHGNWKSFMDCYLLAKDTITMNNRGYSFLKRNFTRSYINKLPNTIRNVNNDSSEEKLNPMAEKALYDFLEYCKDNSINNIVFTRFPHIIADDESYKRYKRTNTIEEIISKYSYPMYNFDKVDYNAEIDIDNDYYDNEHLNIYGQKKMTKCLSEILIKDFNISKSEITKGQKDKWNNCTFYYNKFCKYVENKIANKEDEWVTETAELIKKLDKQN